jgi:hypothetical protein
MSDIAKQMRCCETQSTAGRCSAASSGRRWRGASACAGSGAMLVLLPKCPACIAAYLAVWTGAGLAAPIAGHLRVVMAVIFVASLGVLLARRWMMRTEC